VPPSAALGEAIPAAEAGADWRFVSDVSSDAGSVAVQ